MRYQRTLLGFAMAVGSSCMLCCSTEVATTDNFEVVELPDGSLAYLNRQSKLKYDDDFVNRTVALKGEAFFDVDDGETPFVVHTSMGDVIVTGTEFDVKVGIEEISVEVEKGAVEVKSQAETSKVGRGEVFRKTSDGIIVGKADFEFKVWMKELSREFKKLGKEIKRHSKRVDKESRKAGKKLKKELKKLNLD
jgi:ferric-dicitrate binding protein FerR (iron transport regulator)